MHNLWCECATKFAKNARAKHAQEEALTEQEANFMNNEIVRFHNPHARSFWSVISETAKHVYLFKCNRGHYVVSMQSHAKIHEQCLFFPMESNLEAMDKISTSELFDLSCYFESKCRAVVQFVKKLDLIVDLTATKQALELHERPIQKESVAKVAKTKKEQDVTEAKKSKRKRGILLLLNTNIEEPKPRKQSKSDQFVMDYSTNGK